MRMRASPCGLPRTRTRKCVPVGPGIQDLAAPVARRQAIGDVALADERRQARRRRVVGADHDQSIERHLVGKVQKRGGQRRLGAEVVQVLAVDVGHHRDHREQVAERAVGLVGLGDQDLALAEARVRPERARLAADDRRRIEPGVARGSTAIIVVVVVLPWLPATATPSLTRISSPSISARGMTGMSRARAAAISGLSGRTALETTTTSARATFSARWPMPMRGAQRRQPARDVALAQVGAGDRRSRGSAAPRRCPTCRCRRCRRSGSRRCACRTRVAFLAWNPHAVPLRISRPRDGDQLGDDVLGGVGRAPACPSPRPSRRRRRVAQDLVDQVAQARRRRVVPAAAPPPRRRARTPARFRSGGRRRRSAAGSGSPAAA